MANTYNPALETRSPLLRPFYPALDGLRALAFIATFLVHYGPMAWNTPIVRWGWVGVDLFFVLSGFLITGILSDTKERPDFFKTFYVRRALRIFPLFYGFWIVVLLLTPLFHVQWNRAAVELAAYVGNWFFPFVKLQNIEPGLIYFSLPWGAHHVCPFELTHMWSLCVEEQFYMVWPAVVWLVRSKRTLLHICLAAVVLGPIGRFLFIHFHPIALQSGSIYVSTLTRVDSLLVGAAIALWLRISSPKFHTMRIGAGVVGVGSPLLLAVLWFQEKSHPGATLADPVVCTIGYTLIALTAAAVLLSAMGLSQTMTRALQWKPLASLGRISYGLYFFHLIPAKYFASKVDLFRHYHAVPVLLLIVFGYTYAAAWLSFRFYESRFLRLKHVFAPDKSHVADPQPLPVHVAPQLARHYGAQADYV